MIAFFRGIALKLSYSKQNYYFSFISDLSIGTFAIVYSIYYFEHKWWGATLAITSGIFLWTITEYVFHRFWFHSTNPESVIYKGHDFHHDHPTSIVAMPFFTGGLMFFLALGLCYYVMPLHYALMFVGSYVIFYSYYGIVHHMTHHHKPKSRYYKKLLGMHNVHHRRPDLNYGVVTLFWDRVFGTYSKMQKKDNGLKSATDQEYLTKIHPSR